MAAACHGASPGRSTLISSLHPAVPAPTAAPAQAGAPRPAAPVKARTPPAARIPTVGDFALDELHLLDRHTTVHSVLGRKGAVGDRSLGDSTQRHRGASHERQRKSKFAKHWMSSLRQRTETSAPAATRYSIGQCTSVWRARLIAQRCLIAHEWAMNVRWRCDIVLIRQQLSRPRSRRSPSRCMCCIPSTWTRFLHRRRSSVDRRYLSRLDARIPPRDRLSFSGLGKQPCGVGVHSRTIVPEASRNWIAELHDIPSRDQRRRPLGRLRHRKSPFDTAPNGGFGSKVPFMNANRRQF